MYQSLRFLNNGFSAYSASADKDAKKALKVVTQVAKKLGKLSPTALTAALYQIQTSNPLLYSQLVGSGTLGGAGAASSVPPVLYNQATGVPVTPYQNGVDWYAVTTDASGASILAKYQPNLGWVNSQTGTLVNQQSYLGQYNYQIPPQNPYTPQTNSGYQAVYNPQTGQWVNPLTGVPMYQPSSNQYATPFYQTPSYTPSYQPQYYPQSYNPQSPYVQYPQMPTYQYPYMTDPSASPNDFPIQDSSGVPYSTLMAIQAGLRSDTTGIESDAFNIDPFSSFPTIYPYGAAPTGYTPWVSGGLMTAAVVGLGIYLMTRKPKRATRRASRR